MIEFIDVSFSYPDSEPVFVNLNYCAEKGKINIITGASGIGKTTLLNLAAGLLTVSEGRVYQEDKDGSIDRGAGYVFQEPRLINELTVFKNLDVALASSIADKALRHEQILNMLKVAGLVDAQKKYPSELSGGMAQRVALIRALLYPSNLLLMDEPFKGLDENTKSSLVKIFIEDIKSKQKTVLYVTHEIDLSYLDSEALSSKKAIISNKKIDFFY